MATHIPKQHGGADGVPGAHRYKDVLSPMEEDFRPEDGHEPSEKCITNGVPGYPKGSDRKADEVIFFEGGNFGKFKRD